MTEELYNKIDKFCNETDWSKYPTYEHALEEFIKGIVAEETKELEKENAELKEKLEVVIALKNEEMGCIETDFNTFKSKAKEIIKTCLGFMQAFGYSPSIDKFVTDAEQFISEVEK